MKTVANIKGIKVPFITRHEGTEDCEVHFRVTKSLYQAFLKFYGKTHNSFKAFELYAQGGGWYAAYTDNFVKDGAIRVRRLLNKAIEASKEGLKTCADWVGHLRELTAMKEADNRASCGNQTIRKTVENGIIKNGKVQVRIISRAVQAAKEMARTALSLQDEMIKQELQKLHRTALLSEYKLAQLQTRFAK